MQRIQIITRKSSSFILTKTDPALIKLTILYIASVIATEYNVPYRQRNLIIDFSRTTFT